VPGVPDPLPSADELPLWCFFFAFFVPPVEPSPLPADPTASVWLGATPVDPELPVVAGEPGPDEPVPPAAAPV
jgi:hypothetical protein